MGTDGIDYAAVLADLEAKRAALEQTIQGIRQIMGLSTSGGSNGSPSGGPPGGGIRAEEVPDGAFFNMSVPEATRTYLRMVRKKQSTKQIAEALRRGGLHSTAKNFVTTVYTTLDRQDDLTRVDGDWVLLEWYPALRKKRGKKADVAKDSNDGGDGDAGDSKPKEVKASPKAEPTKKAVRA